MVLKLCLAQTTAHGLGNISNERHISGKIIWLILTILMTVFFLIHAYLLYGQLQEEQILVSTYQHAVDFIQPDIVFCSDRIFARDFINDPPKEEYEFMLNVSKTIQKFDEKFKPSKEFLTAPIWDLLNSYQLYKAFFHRPQELFLRITCNLRDIDLDLSKVKVELNFLYFACFRLEAKVCRLQTPFDNLIVKFYTYIYGLNITYSKLNVRINNRTIDTYLFDQKDRVDEMEDGIHIYFTRPNEGISSHLPKITAPVNTHTYVKVRSTRFDRVPTKKFQCRDSTSYVQIYNLLEENVHDKSINVSEYSLCMQIAFQQELFKKGRCLSKQFPIPKNLTSKLKFCAFKSYMGIWRSPQMTEMCVKYCKTKTVCSVVHHNALANYNHWPRRSTMRQMFRNDVPRKLNFSRMNRLPAPGLEEAFLDSRRNPSNIDSWKRNFIKVSISPGEFRSTLVVESLQYSFKNFFSDVGGIMGLYMGASLLTVSEVFRLLHYLLQSCYQSKDKDIPLNSIS